MFGTEASDGMVIGANVGNSGLCLIKAVATADADDGNFFESGHGCGDALVIEVGNDAVAGPGLQIGQPRDEVFFDVERPFATVAGNVGGDAAHDAAVVRRAGVDNQSNFQLCRQTLVVGYHL